MPTFDAHKNFAYSTIAVAPIPAASGTSLDVQAGDGVKFPAVSFNAVVWPTAAQPTVANAEVVRVTVIATDTFTITRTQEGSAARTIVAGDQIAAAGTSKVLTDIEAYLAGTASGAILTGSIDDGNVFTDMLSLVSYALPANRNFVALEQLEIAAAHTLEVPASSTLEIFDKPAVPSSFVKVGVFNLTGAVSYNHVVTGVGFRPSAVFLMHTDASHESGTVFNIGLGMAQLGGGAGAIAGRSATTPTVSGAVSTTGGGAIGATGGVLQDLLTLIATDIDGFTVAVSLPSAVATRFLYMAIR